MTTETEVSTKRLKLRPFIKQGPHTDVATNHSGRDLKKSWEEEIKVAATFGQLGLQATEQE